MSTEKNIPEISNPYTSAASGARKKLDCEREMLDDRYMQSNKPTTSEIISAARIARAVAAGSVAIFALALAIAL